MRRAWPAILLAVAALSGCKTAPQLPPLPPPGPVTTADQAIAIAANRCDTSPESWRYWTARDVDGRWRVDSSTKSLGGSTWVGTVDAADGKTNCPEMIIFAP